MNDIYVTVTGWVAKTPELRVTAENTAWTTLRVGSTPRRRTAEGQWVDGVTQWFDVKVWDRVARNVAASIRGSDPVIVSGRMVTEEWETDEGTRSKLPKALGRTWPLEPAVERTVRAIEARRRTVVHPPFLRALMLARGLLDSPLTDRASGRSLAQMERAFEQEA